MRPIYRLKSNFKLYKLYCYNTFSVILAGEGTTTMSTPSAICINNNFSTSKTSVTLWTTNNKSTRWLEMVYSIIVHEFGWDNGIDDLNISLVGFCAGSIMSNTHLFSELSAHIIIIDIVGVLGRDDNSIDTSWNDFTISQNMFTSDLSFGILNKKYKPSLVFFTGLIVIL